jgi:hypothetical protein
MKKQQDGSPNDVSLTKMGTCTIKDGIVRIKIKCSLAIAPIFLTHVEKILRDLAQEEDPKGLAKADEIGAIFVGPMTEKTNLQNGNG